MNVALYLAVTLTCVLAYQWQGIPFEQEAVFSWDKFKNDYKKTFFNDHEEQRRFAIYAENLKYILEHNLKYRFQKSSFYLDINQFADLSQEEFTKLYTGSFSMEHDTDNTKFLPPSNDEVPSAIDWRTKGYVTPVKNQGSQCSSGWSFSAVGAIEGQHARKTGKLISLSEQQLIDCSCLNYGCYGGNKINAFMYVKRIGGIPGESDYPYAKKRQICYFDLATIRATVSDYVVVPRNETSLQSAVASEGPVSVSIDASARSFRFYKGGVYDEPACSSDDPLHAALLVGYGTSPSDYWLVKNSWGTSWGDGGYIQMSRNKNNQCGIATRAAYPTVNI